MGLAEVQALTIGSEEEAWEYLRRALSGEAPEALPEVRFEGWPKLEVYLPATPTNASISPSMMEAFLDLQNAIYRSHAVLLTGRPNARALSKAERERLEFRVRVEGGSSHYKVDLTHIADTLGVAVIGKMEPWQVLVAILGVAIVTASTVGYLAYLKHRTEVRKAELEEKGKEHYFDAFSELAKEDTARQQMWLDAMKAVPPLARVQQEADVAKGGIIKALGEEGGGTVNGIAIGADVANDLVSNTRKRAQQETIKAAYRVAKVDTTVPDGFRVTFRDSDGSEISASLQDALISEEHRERIRKAEWSKAPVLVELAIRRSRGRITEAVVVDVQEPKAA